MAKPEPQAEIRQIVSAAHALHLDSPIIHYRILGERIELWTVHGGPFIYDPGSHPKPAASKPAGRRSKRD